MKRDPVKPIVIKNPETGETLYTLEFNRKTIKAAERNGFDISEVGKYPMTKPVELFYYAMRMHQPWVTMDKAEEIFDALDIRNSEGVLKRLLELYNEPFRSMQGDDEGSEKNGLYLLDM